MTRNTSDNESGHATPNQDSYDRAAGARARARREELGLSREALASLTGLSTSTFGRWETRGIPTYILSREQQAWERALNVSAGWFFEADERAVASDPYVEAGQRASLRRETLGITRRAVAASVGISIEVLARWERVGAPVRIKAAQVAAWEQALKVEPGRLLGKVLPATTVVEKARVTISAPDARSSIIEVATRVAAARFEAFAPGETRADHERVSARIFAQRYGVDAADGPSLAAIAKCHGIVESRVSQILKALNSVVQGLNINAGVFERIREQAQPHLPCSLYELEVLLRPLLGDGITPEDVNRFCTDVLGKPLFAFAKRRVNGRREIMVTSPDAGDAVAEVSVHDTAIVEMAHAMIRAAGVAHMGLLKTYAMEEQWATDVIAKVAIVLERTTGFEWLETPAGGKPQWFWLRGHASERNLILDATRRALAVAAGAIAFDEIMGAIERLRTMRARHAVFSPMFDVQPPTRIVWALLERQPWLSALSSGAGIRSLQKIEPQAVLSPSERTLYEALCEAGGVATRAWLFDHLVGGGRMDETSFRSAMLWAPAITRPYWGVYGVRGFQPDPDVLAQVLRESHTRTSSELPMEVDTQAGRAVFHQIINDWHLRGGWVTLPAALVAHVPPGRYTCHPDGSDVEVCASERATITIKGIARILRARGLGVSDVIRLTFDMRVNRLLVDRVLQSEFAVLASPSDG
ncbi:MAG TPA: helix-turn-helix transcriptional regulator [Paraburkholderia sp.]|jgi:transcriptional regulator with XRE-family HTH domain|uniref:helix-turn-helix transcriptional regulator n=1 Tax=Paraburkholderia sp. TaxID=1926495 RepID=UPI002DE2958B|nr:helix-turn-helix transcriptional regulator [Paraburkholderia sp.]